MQQYKFYELLLFSLLKIIFELFIYYFTLYGRGALKLMPRIDLL